MADNLETIKCPACSKEMKKVFLNTQKINIDVCLDGCGGMFFDNREFKKVDEKVESITELLQATEGKEFIRVSESTARICPYCGVKMVRNFASPKHAVKIDECYSCGGKFLDAGELDKIRNEYNSEEEAILEFNEIMINKFKEDII